MNFLTRTGMKPHFHNEVQSNSELADFWEESPGNEAGKGLSLLVKDSCQ